MTEAEDWRETVNKLKKAQDEVRAHEATVEGASSGGRQTAKPSSGAYRPNAQAAPAGPSRSSKGSRSVQEYSPYVSGRSGTDARSLGNGRAQHGSVKSSGRESSGGDSGSREDDRQATWAEDTLGPAWDFVREKVKRAMVYAGFDLQGDADTLTAEDEQKFLPVVVGFIHHVGIGLDYGLTHLNRDKVESDIWTFSDEEAEAVARWYLRRARKVGWMAQAARQMGHLGTVGETKDVAWIVGKRLATSGLFIQQNGGLHPWINK